MRNILDDERKKVSRMIPVLNRRVQGSIIYRDGERIKEAHVGTS